MAKSTGNLAGAAGAPASGRCGAAPATPEAAVPDPARTGNAGPQRLHYLDTMRGMLMLLGVVLHSSNPYSSGAWRVNDPQRIPLLDAVDAGVSLFRMPAFFVIAGFFAIYLLGRRPTATFVRERMRRVLVPLVVMLLTVNLVQLWFLSGYPVADPAGFIDAVLLPAMQDGDLASHLWFLAALAIYFLLVALFAPQLRALAVRAPGTSLRVAGAVYLAVLAAAVLAPLAVTVAAQLSGAWIERAWLNEYVLGVVRVSTVLKYLPFFAVGVLLGADPRLLDRFARISRWVPGLGLLAGFGLFVAVGRDETAWKAVALVSESLLAWMAVRVIFALFRRLADRPTRTFRYLSDASYSVYLFHHLVVIVVATWLLALDVDAWLKFTIVLVTASVVSLLAYHFLIRRSRVLRYLFNGAIRPPASAVQPPHAPVAATAIVLPARRPP